MIKERKPMLFYTNGKEHFGCIELDRLADPDTVCVTFKGKRLKPISFDILGQPIFSEEQSMLAMYQEEQVKRETGEEIKAEISYEEREFNVPRACFDSYLGVWLSISNLSTLNEMLNNRRIFHKKYPHERLAEYMIFGCFKLDACGQSTSIEEHAFGKYNSFKDVAPFEVFMAVNKNVVLIGKYNSFKDVASFGVFMAVNKNVVLTSRGYVIPRPDQKCPCCGEIFTIADIKRNPCVCENGTIYHASCYYNYRRLTEVDKFTRRLMDSIYEQKDYTFDLLPNGYCNQKCCSHIPWFMFHTPDGDIKMGWRKRVISIEWQENYKPFDMNIFSEEDVTKWEGKDICKPGKKIAPNTVKRRGIHAWGEKNAYKYLKMVRKLVNPSYKREYEFD